MTEETVNGKDEVKKEEDADEVIHQCLQLMWTSLSDITEFVLFLLHF